MHQLNPLHYHQIIHQFRVLLAAIRLSPVVHRLANTSDAVRRSLVINGTEADRCAAVCDKPGSHLAMEYYSIRNQSVQTLPISRNDDVRLRSHYPSPRCSFRSHHLELYRLGSGGSGPHRSGLHCFRSLAPEC
jgi:hypothetical protein